MLRVFGDRYVLEIVDENVDWYILSISVLSNPCLGRINDEYT